MKEVIEYHMGLPPCLDKHVKMYEDYKFSFFDRTLPWRDSEVDINIEKEVVTRIKNYQLGIEPYNIYEIYDNGRKILTIHERGHKIGWPISRLSYRVVLEYLDK